MAGYSGTPLPKKLDIRQGHRVAVVNGPRDIGKTLGDLPENVTVQVGLSGRERLNVVLLFATRRVELERHLPEARPRIAESGSIWVAWPKRASKVSTDMTEHVVRGVALPAGLVDNKVCAIDETWTGLRLVIRVKLRGSL